MDEPTPQASRFGWFWSRLAGYQGNRGLSIYVLLVIGAGAALLCTEGRHAPILSWAFFLWFFFSVVAELLWLETPTGDATDSMASTFNVAVLYLFGQGLALWVIGLSVLIATRYVQKRDWTKSLFGLGQMVITAFVAGGLFEWMAGGSGSLAQFRTARGVGSLVLTCVAYFAVNTFLVAGAVSLERKTPIWSTWRTNYVYRNALLSSGALFALSPILLLSYLSLGYPGVLLFFLPLVIVKNQNREYIELQRTTQALISSERMAAKGEMAASVAHEMRNYLAVIQGRLELLQRKIARQGLDEFKKDTEILGEQTQRLTRLSRGLLDFSHRELKVTHFDLNSMCRELVEFLQPQNAYDRVKLEFDCQLDLMAVEGDAGQIHQVLINLCRNAADALRDAGVEQGIVVIRTRRADHKHVCIEVEDNGPGVPAAVKQRIFEPGFTTKGANGNGFGLATSYRIAESHGGRIWIEDRPGGGARFCLAWPPGKAPGEEAKAA